MIVPSVYVVTGSHETLADPRGQLDGKDGLLLPSPPLGGTDKILLPSPPLGGGDGLLLPSPSLGAEDELLLLPPPHPPLHLIINTMANAIRMVRTSLVDISKLRFI